MTTKTLSTYVAAGYTLSTSFNTLVITSTGGVGGTGVLSTHYASIYNYGKIHAAAGSYGVRLTQGGRVFNGAPTAELVTLQGDGGVDIEGASGFVSNLGTILADGDRGQYGVVLRAGGNVINGNGADTRALIQGDHGVDLMAYGTVSNFGTVKGLVYEGVTLQGQLVNGSVADTQASITGYAWGVFDFAGTAVNFGTIQGTGVEGFGSGARGGVYMDGGGRLANGATTDHVALIEGYRGVVMAGAGETVANFGTILGESARYASVYFTTYGVLTNGDSGDVGALIEGATGVYAYAGALVTNFGTIDGTAGRGVRLLASGQVANGGDEDRTATIQGAVGVQMQLGGTIRNSGTLMGTGAYSFGAEIYTSGRLTNGSANNAAAMIEGRSGIRLSGAVTAANFGILAGLADDYGAGAYLSGGAVLTNGASGHAGGLIEGYLGLEATGPATVTNFGTISGAAGTAVRFQSSADLLIVEAGSTFVGAVLGGGGTLDLDSGSGTLGLLSGEAVTVSGSMAATTFQTFSAVEIGVTASFVTSGAVTIVTGQSVIDAGALTLGSTKAGVANSGTIETLVGTLTVKGAVTGKGTATINGGTLDFTSSFNQTVTFAGTTGILELGQSQTYTATITGFSKTGKTSLDLADIAFVGSGEATYSGTSKSGVLTVTDGTHTAHINLKGNYLTSTFVAASDGHGGVIIHDPRHAFVAAMAGLGAGAGQVNVTPGADHPTLSTLARPGPRAP